MCPACRGALILAAERAGTSDLLVEGTLSCEQCGRRYPVEGGVAYLAVLDTSWTTILKELINRRELIEHNMRNPGGGADASSGRKAEQEESVNALADMCFAEACRMVPEGRPLRLLDCGAGMFETSAAFASQGLDVTATETEISMARYCNFRGEAHLDPQPFSIDGTPYHIRDPEGHPHHFSRIVGDIQRLPFREGHFDVAFCRAMLHHVDRVDRAIGEMARVVRPGGLILIAAEPARSILDSEEAFHECSVDREVGMNERAPTLLAYRRPLAAACSEVSIHYWPMGPMGRSGRIFSLIRYDYRRHLRAGEILRDWRWVKLLPWASAVNLYGRRGSRPLSPPPIVQGDVPTIEAVANVYISYDNDKTLDGLHQGTNELQAMRRRLLARNARRFPQRVLPGKTQGMVLESGWGRAERAGGVRFRHVLRHATIFLSVPRSASRLAVVHGGGELALPYEVEVIVNGEVVGALTGSESAWKRETFPLGQEARDNGLAEIEFVSKVFNRHEASRTDVGAAIRSLEVC